MSLSGSFPVTVILERYLPSHRWAVETWRPAAVLPGRLAPPGPDGQGKSVSELVLELYDDDGEGYFENWAGPEPKVFILWRVEDELARVVRASVSYAEGTRMLDSGEAADALAMPPEIHDWLGNWLRLHYRPRTGKGREHG